MGDCMRQLNDREDAAEDELIRAPSVNSDESGSEGLSSGEASGEDDDDDDAGGPAAWLPRLQRKRIPAPPRKGGPGPSLASLGRYFSASASVLWSSWSPRWASLSARWSAFLGRAPEEAEEGEGEPLLGADDADIERGTSSSQQRSEAASAALVCRFKHVFCGPRPTANALRVCGDAVAAGTLTLGLVTCLEALSLVELKLVRIDAFLENHSERLFAAWIKAPPLTLTLAPTLALTLAPTPTPTLTLTLTLT